MFTYILRKNLSDDARGGSRETECQHWAGLCSKDAEAKTWTSHLACPWHGDREQRPQWNLRSWAPESGVRCAAADQHESGHWQSAGPVGKTQDGPHTAKTPIVLSSLPRRPFPFFYLAIITYTVQL